MKELAFTIPGGSGTINFKPVASMPTLGPNTLSGIIQFGITTFLIVITLASLIFIIWGGIQWITSSGDKNKIDAAKKRITYAIIGLVIAFLSFFIVRTVGNLFGVKNLVGPECRVRTDCPKGFICNAGRCTFLP